MTLTELRIELLKQGKTVTWLAQQLNYSTTYLYRMVETGNVKELDRINEILKGGK